MGTTHVCKCTLPHPLLKYKTSGYKWHSGLPFLGFKDIARQRGSFLEGIGPSEEQDSTES